MPNVPRNRHPFIPVIYSRRYSLHTLADSNRRDFHIDGVLSSLFESIRMGNGDIGASVNILPHELIISLAKADVWDYRLESSTERIALKHDDLISMIKASDHDLAFYKAPRPGVLIGYLLKRYEFADYGSSKYFIKGQIHENSIH